MTIDEITTTLEERGVIWQAIGFGLIGIVSVALLSIYSESDYQALKMYRLAVTELSWAFVGPILVTIDGVRKMFETKTAIRKAAREKAIDKARKSGLEEGLEEGLEKGLEKGLDEGLKTGDRRAVERIRASLLKHGVELPPELEHELFENGHSR